MFVGRAGSCAMGFEMTVACVRELAVSADTGICLPLARCLGLSWADAVSCLRVLGCMQRWWWLKGQKVMIRKVGKN